MRLRRNTTNGTCRSVSFGLKGGKEMSQKFINTLKFSHRHTRADTRSMCTSAVNHHADK